MREYLGKGVFRFTSFEHWVAKARSWCIGYKKGTLSMYDTRGRRCRCGHDFALARDDGAFPVVVYHNE